MPLGLPFHHTDLSSAVAATKTSIFTESLVRVTTAASVWIQWVLNTVITVYPSVKGPGLDFFLSILVIFKYMMNVFCFLLRGELIGFF